MSDGIHELGKNAHNKVVSAGAYAVAPDGRIALVQPHMPLKDGWRLATAEDLKASIARELERRGVEKTAADEAEQAARAASHERGELERAVAALQADRAAAKLAAITKNKHVIAKGDVEIDEDGEELADEHIDPQASLKAIAGGDLVEQAPAPADAGVDGDNAAATSGGEEHQ